MTTPTSNARLFEIGGPASSAWREEMLTEAEELVGLNSWILALRESSEHDPRQPTGRMPEAIEQHLSAVKQTACGQDEHLLGRKWHEFNGSSFERALGNLDAAEVHLLRLAPSPVLKGALPSIMAHVNRFLPKDDPRRVAVEKIAGGVEAAPLEPAPLEQEQRDVLIAATHAANTQRRRNLIRLRGFRNMLLGGIIVFVLIGGALGLIGSVSPTTIPLCFTPESDGRVTVVCPRAETPIGPLAADHDVDPDIARTVTSGDVWLVELLGLLGAALVGAAALRKLRSSSTPYGVHVALAAFKLPTGAVTAVLGLLLMRADFVPGLSALDSSAQILGWAVIFGIAQQLVTRFADSQAAGLLENVGGRGAAGDRPIKDEPPAS